MLSALFCFYPNRMIVSLNSVNLDQYFVLSIFARLLLHVVSERAAVLGAAYITHECGLVTLKFEFTQAVHCLVSIIVII